MDQNDQIKFASVSVSRADILIPYLKTFNKRDILFSLIFVMNYETALYF
jgi:hypothetical protein